MTAKVRLDYPARLARLQARMREEGIGVYVATRQASLSWLLGAFAPWRTAVVVPADGTPRAVFWRSDASRLRSETWLRDVREWGGERRFVDVVAEAVREIGGERERIGVDLGSPVSPQVAPGLLLASEYLELMRQLPDAHWVNAVPMIEDVLAVKEDEEIELLRRAAQIADIGMIAARSALKPGVTENAVAGEVERAIRLAGSEWSWSSTQGTEVGSGYRTAYPGGVTQPATEKKIEAGEMVIVDLHPMFQLYLSDLAGNFYMGESPPPRVRALADCWERTVETLLNVLRPGLVIQEAVDLGFSVMREHGFETWGLRAFGHGLGTCARTPPYMVDGNRAELREKMVLALGTHIYEPGVGGMRLEYPVLITASGCEPLCRWPAKLHCVKC